VWFESVDWITVAQNVESGMAVHLDQLSDYQLLSDSQLYGVVCGEEPLLSHRLSKNQGSSTVVENTE
jgi:hypothetical protein